MTEFVEFLKVYWFQLVTAVCFVIEIVFIFIKRRPKSVDEFKAALNEVVTYIPIFVTAVEEAGNGEKKKTLVIENSVSLFEKLIGRKLSSAELASVSSVFDKAIESVLVAPQKKGDLNEK